MASDRFGIPGSTEPPLLDVAASRIRTALTDPAGLDEVEEGRLKRAALAAGGHVILVPYGMPRADPLPYAVDGLDYIIEQLNPSLETRETMAATLTLLGRHLAERADEMIARDADASEDEQAAYRSASSLVDAALDLLDHAIALLVPEAPE